MSGTIICGVDEAGRGPLAGPVIAAAVILDPVNPISELADSKKISPAKRETLCEEIKHKAICWAVGRADVEEIDRLNILQATLLAMKRAVIALDVIPQLVLIDGNQKPALEISMEAIVKGDELIKEISAASILAKVTRDLEMLELDRAYPQYGFSRHKGYPTKAHVAALEEHGVSPIHRQSFGPVKRLLSSV
jgi:ribonuclease HII